MTGHLATWNSIDGVVVAGVAIPLLWSLLLVNVLLDRSQLAPNQKYDMMVWQVLQACHHRIDRQKFIPRSITHSNYVPTYLYCHLSGHCELATVSPSHLGAWVRTRGCWDWLVQNSKENQNSVIDCPIYLAVCFA